MNFRIVIYQLGLVLLVLSLCMLLIVGCSAVAWFSAAGPAETIAIESMLISAVLGTVVGLALWLIGRRSESDSFGPREALLLVGVSWLIGAAFAGVPYYLWAILHPDHGDGGVEFASLISCYFEAMSGLTTTGATVLSDIESIPNSLLLWRATTQWLGGLGIIVLFVAVLPTLGVGGKKLFQTEVAGPTQKSVRPRIRDTARMLWFIYILFTIVLILLLALFGMDWFDAVCHSFTTVATGGFSTHNASIGHYQVENVGVTNFWGIHLVILVGIVLGGVNFGLYYQLARRRFNLVWTDPELRLYLCILLVASLLVALNIYATPIVTTGGEKIEAGLDKSLLYGAFHVASIGTSAGFCTADSDLWPFTSQAVLVILMFVGASAGSTGGGIKVVRVLIAFKVILAEVNRVFRPRVVRTIRVGRAVVDSDQRQSVLVYLLGIVALFAVGTVLLMLLEPRGSLDITTAATASAATLNNIGPGLGRVGAIENYGFFTPASKLVMCILMALGRLEVFAIFVLFVPSFWRQG